MNPESKTSGDWFWFAARIAVGILFAYAGFMKLTEPRANFEAVLAGYPLIPSAWIPLVAAVSPWCEWILGMLLILGYAPRTCAAAVSIFLAIFLILIASGPLWGGQASADCGCFGKGGLRISTRTIFCVDFVALILAVLLAWRNRFPFSLDRYLFIEKQG